MYMLFYLYSVVLAGLYTDATDIPIAQHCGKTIRLDGASNIIYNGKDLNDHNRSCELKLHLQVPQKDICVRTIQFDSELQVQYGSLGVADGFYDEMYDREVRQTKPYCSKGPIFVNLKASSCYKGDNGTNITLEVYIKGELSSRIMKLSATTTASEPKTTTPAPPNPNQTVGHIGMAIAVVMLCFVMTPLVIFVVTMRQIPVFFGFRTGSNMLGRVISVDASTATTGAMAGQLPLKPAFPSNPSDV